MNNIIEINDYNSKELDAYARLTERQLFHPQKGTGSFIAESPVVIERALDAGFRPLSLLMERSQVYGHAKNIIPRCGDIPIYVSSLDVLEKITGYTLTRGILCAMERRDELSWENITCNSSRIVVLEDIVNPTNIGAIFRSAAALGMEAVLLTDGCCDPLYRRAIRVSMGTVFQVPWAHISSISELSRLGFKTVAMALKDNAVPIDSPLLMEEDKLAVVLGTEGDGLSDGTIFSCDYTVKIPMSNGVDSLNVAAASAVAFWQLRKL